MTVYSSKSKCLFDSQPIPILTLKPPLYLNNIPFFSKNTLLCITDRTINSIPGIIESLKPTICAALIYSMCTKLNSF